LRAQSGARGCTVAASATTGRVATSPCCRTGGSKMAKGQVKKEKTNKPKLSAKQKKANKAAKKAAKGSK
jgi:hypothetical protein